MKLVSTNLSMFVSQKKPQKEDQNLVKFGFLTLDSKQRLLILTASDPLTLKVPLVGVWMYNINIFQKQNYLWGLLCEFVKNKQTSIKFLYNKNKFIFISFNFNQNPEFYEISIQKDRFYNMINNKFNKLQNIQFEYSEQYLTNGINFKKQEESFYEEIPYNMIPKAQEKQNYSFIKQSNIDEDFIKNSNIYGQQHEQNQQHQQHQQYKQHQQHQQFQQNQQYQYHNQNQQNSQQNQQNNQQNYKQNNQQNNQENQQEMKMSYFAERLLQQQDQQLKFLQQQVLELQAALIKQNPQHPLVQNQRQNQTLYIKESQNLNQDHTQTQLFDFTDIVTQKNSTIMNQNYSLSNKKQNQYKEQSSFKEQSNIINNSQNEKQNKSKFQNENSSNSNSQINQKKIDYQENNHNENQDKSSDQTMSLSKIQMPNQQNISQKSNLSQKSQSNLWDLQNILQNNEIEQVQEEPQEVKKSKDFIDNDKNLKISSLVDESDQLTQQDLKMNLKFMESVYQKQEEQPQQDLRMNMKFLDSIYQDRLKSSHDKLKSSHDKLKNSQDKLKNSHGSDINKQFQDSVFKMPQIQFYKNNKDISESSSDDEQIKYLEKKYQKLKNLQQ